MRVLNELGADLTDGIAVTPVFAAKKQEALKVAKVLFTCHRVIVVLKEGEPPGEITNYIFPRHSPFDPKILFFALVNSCCVR